ncbi:MAG: DUF3343 domain-containing protein [Oligoflexales bacterium]|nr:DUF3343 domain-containing protein [Oligoflexales bacterium]
MFVLVESVSHALIVEKFLKEAFVPNKLVPVPRDISSSCGICVRFEAQFAEKVSDILSNEESVRHFSARVVPSGKH